MPVFKILKPICINGIIVREGTIEREADKVKWLVDRGFLVKELKIKKSSK
jgi:hypothetical protein